MSDMSDSPMQTDAIIGLIPEILKRPGSLVETFTSDNIVIRRSMAARVLLTFVVFCCAAMVCGFLAIPVAFMHRADKPPLGTTLFLVVLALVPAIGGLLLLPQAGPLRLECDLRQRTYRFTRATPRVETSTGSLSDLASVSVQTYQTASRGGQAAPVSRVLLTWKNAPLVMGRLSPSVIAYVALGPDDADVMARSLSARLRIPMA